MRETLIIKLHEDSFVGHADVLLLDAVEVIQAEHSAMAWPEISRLAINRRVQVLTPGTASVLTQVKIPSQRRSRILRALPYALEEQFAADVETLHFALGDKQEDGHYPVAVTAKAQMDVWIALLQEHDIHADIFIPETLTLSYVLGSWSLYINAGQTILRDGTYSGVMFETSLLNFQLSLSLQNNDTPTQLNIFSDDPAWEFNHESFVDCDIQRQNFDSKHRLAPLNPLTSKGVINLLQGDYSRSEQLGKLLRPWRVAASLLCVALVLSAGQKIASYQEMQVERLALSQQMTQEYKRAFPHAKRIVNPKVQMEQGLKKLRRGGAGANDSGFLELMTKMGVTLKTQSGVKLNGTSFRDGRLDLTLVADNLQVLDGFKQALEMKQEMQVEIQSATTDAQQKVQGRIRIKGSRS